MHIHIGAMDFLIVWAYIIIGAYIWRALAAHFSDSPIGQAMAFIF
jgi:hypothetical protein